VLAGFTLERFIGATDLGEVWEATERREPAPERKVAVRVLSLDGLPGGRDALLRESLLASSLLHRNIVRVLGLQHSGNAAFVSMELARGPTLLTIRQAFLRAGLPIPVEGVAAVLGGACRAVEHAWNTKDPTGAPLKVVHRNLGPTKILVCEDGVARVWDFGLAKVADDERKTITGAVRGQLRYIAPERLAGGRDYNAGTDLFSVGVMLCELLSGEDFYPRGGFGRIVTTLSERAVQAEVARFVAPRAPSLAGLAERLLAREPKDRIQDPGEAAAELERAAGAGGAEPAIAGLLAAWKEALAAPRKAVPADESTSEDLPALGASAAFRLPVDGPPPPAALKPPPASGPKTQDWSVVREEPAPKTQDWSVMREEPAPRTQDWSVIREEPEAGAATGGRDALAAARRVAASGAIDDDGDDAQASSGRPAWLIPALVVAGVAAGLAVLLVLLR
jgi:serine/threonine protein kinase